MPDFLKYVKKDVLLGDGAMGTMLSQKGLPPGQNPDLWVLTNPNKVKAIHKAYLDAGSQVVQTNTFGANSLKLSDFGASDRVKEVNITAARLVREVVGKKAFVAGIVGPSGQFPAPLGEIPWLVLVDVFKEQVQSLEIGGADFIFLETFSDLGEIRAALFAAKNYTRLPVACSLTYTKGRTLTGTSPEVAAVVLAAMGADLIGANCSTGPDELLPVMEAYHKSTHLPLLVEPNAGMPELINGQTVFRLTPEEMAGYVEPFRKLGVNLIGACCGSTPEHIRAMKKQLHSRQPVKALYKESAFPTRLASRTAAVSLGKKEAPCIIGERINPTARKLIAQAYRDEDWELISREGFDQVEAGALLLDVNAGVPGLNESETLPQAVRKLQMTLDVPLVLDSTNPEALEKALREYQGKALINSVNGEEKSLEAILPLAKKYGAAVLGLTLNEKGIPDNAEDRLTIAKTILKKARAYGLPDQDILIDCLVLTAATSPALAMETVKAISLVKKRLGLTTALGLSNVSHGLPQRTWLNNTFLALCLGAGLDAAIANPLDGRIGETMIAGALLTERDPGAMNYLRQAGKAAALPTSATLGQETSLAVFRENILHGRQDAIISLLDNLLKDHDPLTIINEGITPPLETIGLLFSDGKAYLPQLMLAGDAAKTAFTYLKERFPGQGMKNKGTIVMGTVKGDIHDIGKNIVCALLENYGWRVVDLGKNVEASSFISAVKKEDAKLVGLSALMTTTMAGMPEIIAEIRQSCKGVKIMVGGAVVTPDYAGQIGADGYGKDAVEAVKLAQELLQEA